MCTLPGNKDYYAKRQSGRQERNYLPPPMLCSSSHFSHFRCNAWKLSSLLQQSWGVRFWLCWKQLLIDCACSCTTSSWSQGTPALYLYQCSLLLYFWSNTATTTLWCCSIYVWPIQKGNCQEIYTTRLQWWPRTCEEINRNNCNTALMVHNMHNNSSS